MEGGQLNTEDDEVGEDEVALRELTAGRADLEEEEVEEEVEGTGVGVIAEDEDDC